MKYFFVLLLVCFSFCVSVLAKGLEYNQPVQLCILANGELDESSGLAASGLRENVFWTHNDDEGDNRLFAFDTSGKSLAVCRLKNVKPFDWEDISAFKMNSVNYLLCADVGDKFKERKRLSLYFLEEPSGKDGHGEIPIVKRVDFFFEGGPRNCEAAAVDVRSRSVLFITKEKDASFCEVFSLPLDLQRDATELLRARAVGRLPIEKVTAMDIVPDGSRAVILADEDVYEMPHRKGESWEESLKKGARKIARLPKGQWEAVCYGKDNQTVYATAEKSPTPLFTIKIRERERDVSFYSQ